MFPAESLAHELKRRGWRILLATDARGGRYAGAFPADERFEIDAASPNVGGPVAKTLAALALFGALVKSLVEFRRLRPNAVVGFGGYPSLPALLAARLLRIPCGVHEQNAVLGRANRAVAASSAFTAHGFSFLTRAPAKARLHEVGNPVREAVLRLRHARFEPPAPDGPIRLLVFGGSQGASIFSSVATQAIAELPETLRRRLRLTQQAREAEVEIVRARYAEAGVKAEVAPFFADLPQRMASAHLVMSRAGASTVAELATIGRPAILVPLAIAMDDHQTGNARALSDRGGAIVLPEKEFTQETLRAALGDLLADPDRLVHMAEAARGAVKEGAEKALADLVEGIAGKAR
jgi:UDP-N-acetylglucosamine--N-acetylmuramyl-(pentapeptide) pyrophosphoryl-undecaprenol N-acetylglucosamine transferase